MHCFEPSPMTYEKLVQNTKNYNSIYTNSLALGQTSGEKAFLENSQNNMSSFLKPGEHCWGEIVGETLVEMSTLDRYCEKNRMESIDVLKIDTQGYDFEVLKGAPFLLKHNRIHMIYMEIIFLDIYQDLPPFDMVFRFLNDNNFRLVSFYRFNHQNNLASWSDALFINLQYIQGKNA
jgi:FkbM family methyltransferase